MFSLFINQDGRDSYIKFGGWDPQAVAEGEELKMLKTADKTSWGLHGYGIGIGKTSPNGPTRIFTNIED